MGSMVDNDKAALRSGPRVETVVKVDYRTTDAFFTDFAENMSEGGMFISTLQPLPPGTELLIEFLLPEVNRPLKVKAKVVWSRKRTTTHDKRRGMGVKFEQISKSDKEMIAGVVRKLRSSP